MSDEQLISFITQLVKVAAERLLKQRIKHDPKDVLV